MSAVIVLGLLLALLASGRLPGWPGGEPAADTAPRPVPDRTPVPGGDQPLAAGCFGEEALARGDDVTAYQAFRARAGDARAEFHLGVMFRDGRGVPRNAPAAIAHFLRAANAGDRDALTALGWMYRGDPETGSNFPQARQWFERAALAGDRVAQAHLAAMYQQGHGTERDIVRAWAWLAAGGDEPLPAAGLAVPAETMAALVPVRDAVYRALTREQLARASVVADELRKQIAAADAAATKNNKREVPACAP